MLTLKCEFNALKFLNNLALASFQLCIGFDAADVNFGNVDLWVWLSFYKHA